MDKSIACVNGNVKNAIIPSILPKNNVNTTIDPIIKPLIARPENFICVRTNGVVSWLEAASIRLRNIAVLIVPRDLELSILTQVMFLEFFPRRYVNRLVALLMDPPIRGLYVSA